jgi:hypothetical protein
MNIHAIARYRAIKKLRQLDRAATPEHDVVGPAFRDLIAPPEHILLRAAADAGR